MTTMTTTTATSAAPTVEHPCERCGTRFQRTSKRDSLLCPDCRQRHRQARYLANGRARTWLADQHPDLYAELYEQHVNRARAEDPTASATRIRNRARSRALGDLQRRYPDQYQQRYAAELARAHSDDQADEEQPSQPVVRVPYWQERDPGTERHVHATAQRHALLSLARLYSDTTARLYQVQVARLPLNPADRTPERRRALAWARTLDRLARLHPKDFEARYQAELAEATHLNGTGNPSRPLLTVSGLPVHPANAIRELIVATLQPQIGASRQGARNS
jgi:predicted  nucleic acid-binding Zn-ribbon protein